MPPKLLTKRPKPNRSRTNVLPPMTADQQWMRAVLASGVPAEAFQTDNFSMSFTRAAISKTCQGSFLILDMPSVYCQPVILDYQLLDDEGGDLRTISRYNVPEIVPIDRLQKQIPVSNRSDTENEFAQPGTKGSTVSVFSVLNDIDQACMSLQEYLLHFQKHGTIEDIFDAVALPFHQMLQAVRLANKMFYCLMTQPLIGKEIIIPFKFFQKTKEGFVTTYRQLLRLRSINPRNKLVIDYIPSDDVLEYIVPYGSSFMLANIPWWKKPS